MIAATMRCLPCRPAGRPAAARGLAPLVGFESKPTSFDHKNHYDQKPIVEHDGYLRLTMACAH
jgi:hypothetical protein